MGDAAARAAFREQLDGLIGQTIAGPGGRRKAVLLLFGALMAGSTLATGALGPEVTPWALAALVILFGGLCLGGWQITHSAEVADATQTASRWFAAFTLVTNTLSALGNALVLSVKQLGPIFIGACIVVGLATYLSCLGLGTAFVRLAVARR